jgi:hypothetical protein
MQLENANWGDLHLRAAATPARPDAVSGALHAPDSARNRSPSPWAARLAPKVPIVAAIRRSHRNSSADEAPAGAKDVALRTHHEVHGPRIPPHCFKVDGFSFLPVMRRREKPQCTDQYMRIFRADEAPAGAKRRGPSNASRSPRPLDISALLQGRWIAFAVGDEEAENIRSVRDRYVRNFSADEAPTAGARRGHCS